MKNKFHNKKITTIIVIFIGISIIPSFGCGTLLLLIDSNTLNDNIPVSLGIYTVDEDKDIDYDVETVGSIDDPVKAGEYDDYKEVITFITGSAQIKVIKVIGLIFLCEAEIINDPDTSGIKLLGFRRSNNRGLEKYDERAEYVHAYYLLAKRGFLLLPGIFCFAFGNIDWIKWGPK
jgi:hypothetical protein